MVVLSLWEISCIIFLLRELMAVKLIALDLPPIVVSLKGTAKALSLISHLNECWFLYE